MDRSPSPSSISARAPSLSLPFLVRALHTFDPSSLLSSTSSSSSQQIQSCLAFEAGNVVRCLGRDESGWWDGEVVEWSGQDGEEKVGNRGWFPSNYVEVLGVEEGVVAVGGGETRDVRSVRPGVSSREADAAFPCAGPPLTGRPDTTARHRPERRLARCSSRRRQESALPAQYSLVRSFCAFKSPAGG